MHYSSASRVAVLPTTIKTPQIEIIMRERAWNTQKAWWNSYMNTCICVSVRKFRAECEGGSILFLSHTHTHSQNGVIIRTSHTPNWNICYFASYTTDVRWGGMKGLEALYLHYATRPDVFVCLLCCVIHTMWYN